MYEAATTIAIAVTIAVRFSPDSEGFLEDLVCSACRVCFASLAAATVASLNMSYGVAQRYMQLCLSASECRRLSNS